MGTTWKPPVREDQPQECLHKRLWRTKLKKLCLYIHEEKATATIHQILGKAKTTLGKILAIR